MNSTRDVLAINRICGGLSLREFGCLNLMMDAWVTDPRNRSTEDWIEELPIGVDLDRRAFYRVLNRYFYLEDGTYRPLVMTAKAFATEVRVG